jgi:hypothetical protein
MYEGLQVGEHLCTHSWYCHVELTQAYCVHVPACSDI